ncbi:hypothetical protein Tcan_06449 [Toxocara canis]|uniref:Globin domain-containing protein n=1 Tax=Toxocara canis TaxID=6265 RepID=A0A0B2VNP5_TOXCA|nr:hypothetical protein Tcan_06449 [Toxocara canis]
MHSSRIAQFARRKYARPLSIDGKRLISSVYSGRVLIMDSDQLASITDAWESIPDKYDVFQRLFLRLFMHEDHEFAVHFGLQDLPEEELKNHQKFRTHVCKFQRFIATVVDLLPKVNRNDELIQIIRLVGRQHCNIKTMSFTAEKWLVFKKVLISVLCNDLSQGTLYECWSRLVSFVIYEMKDAYLDYIRRARSNSCPQITGAIKLLDLIRFPSNDDETTVKLSDKS